MLRKLLTLSTVLLLQTTPSMASSEGFQFYTGAQGGGMFTHTHDRVDSEISALDQRAKLSGINRKHFFMGGVFVGIRYFMNSFFLGLECEGVWDNINIKSNYLDPVIGGTWNLRLRRKFQIVPSAVIGWRCSEQTLFYAKFGAGISRFNLTVELLESEHSQNNTVIHFVPALGVEYEVYKDIGLRLEVAGEVGRVKIKGFNHPDFLFGQNTGIRYKSVSLKAGILIKV